jgi:probable phosphoglycerate mutase
VAPDFQRPFTLPAGAAGIVLVRHGSAATGMADPPLTEDGRRQALAVADRLGGETVAGLFVTPLRRTAETAAPLAERLGEEPVVVEDLREVHLGEWDGHLNARLKERSAVGARVFSTGRWDAIPGAEDMDRFSARVRAGADRVADAVGPDRTGVAVVHGGVIAEICRQATNSDAFAFLYVDNGSISRVMRLASGRWALRGFNDVAHL